MRYLIATVVVISTFAGAGGCSSRPPRDVDAAVRQRLTRYSDAWVTGDAAGIRESFRARDAGEAELIAALAELAPAQAQLHKTYRESRDGSVGRILFGDTDPGELIIAARPWDAYAYAAAQPHRLEYDKPHVIAHLDKADETMTFVVRNVDGGWRIDADAFLLADSAARLAAATRRQVEHTHELIAAMRSGDPARVRQVMLRQVVEVRGPARRPIDDIGAPTAGPATKRTSSGAKENPP